MVWQFGYIAGDDFSYRCFGGTFSKVDLGRRGREEAEPMSKQLDFDECFRQNAIFQGFLGGEGQCPNSWILMNVSGKMQLSRLSSLGPANVQTTKF